MGDPGNEVAEGPVTDLCFSLSSCNTSVYLNASVCLSQTLLYIFLQCFCLSSCNAFTLVLMFVLAYCICIGPQCNAFAGPLDDLIVGWET